MATRKSIPIIPRVNPQDPSTYLKPGEQLIGADGRDWSWAYVWFKDIPGRVAKVVESRGLLWVRHATGDRSGEWQRLYARIEPDLGYAVVSINGRRTYLHRLVLSLFYGPCPDGMQCCHINGKESDPRLINLRWGTRTENNQDKRRHGTYWASRPALSNLSCPDVLQIVQLLRAGEPREALAPKFGISADAIKGIERGERWSDCTGIKKGSPLIDNNATALRTHCRNGHEYTPENTRINRGVRQCVACMLEKRKRDRRRHHRRTPDAVTLTAAMAGQ